MIQKIYSSNPVRKSLMAVLFAGAVSCTQAPTNNSISNENMQQKEVASKNASDAIKSNFVAGQQINFDKAGEIKANEYDAQGRLVKEYQYSDEGVLECETTYKYREDGSYSEINMYADGIKWLRVCDANDRIHQAVVYNADGSVDLQYIYAYAPDGAQQEIIYDGQGRVVANYFE